MKRVCLKALCLALCLCFTPIIAQAENTEALSPQVAAILKKDTPHYIVLDIRTPKEFAEGHIKDAVLVDFLAPNFDERINKLDKDVRYILHCRTGARSTRAMAVMEELGFKNVVHMTDGIVGWHKNGLPVEK